MYLFECLDSTPPKFAAFSDRLTFLKGEFEVVPRKGLGILRIEEMISELSGIVRIDRQGICEDYGVGEGEYLSVNILSALAFYRKTDLMNQFFDIAKYYGVPLGLHDVEDHPTQEDGQLVAQANALTMASISADDERECSLEKTVESLIKMIKDPDINEENPTTVEERKRQFFRYSYFEDNKTPFYLLALRGEKEAISLLTDEGLFTFKHNPSSYTGIDAILAPRNSIKTTLQDKRMLEFLLSLDGVGLCAANVTIQPPLEESDGPNSSAARLIKKFYFYNVFILNEASFLKCVNSFEFTLTLEECKNLSSSFSLGKMRKLESKLNILSKTKNANNDSSAMACSSDEEDDDDSSSDMNSGSDDEYNISSSDESSDMEDYYYESDKKEDDKKKKSNYIPLEEHKKTALLVSSTNAIDNIIVKDMCKLSSPLSDSANEPAAKKSFKK